MQSKNLKLLSYFIIFYMLLAFCWWGILLHTKNKDAYQAKVESLRLGMVLEGTYKSEDQFRETASYLSLKQKYDRQERMILGEALVIMLSLGIGLWFVNRGYNDLYKAEKAKQNFLLSVSHELKSPIASIQLALETLQRPKLKAENASIIAKDGLLEAKRLHQLVTNMLMAARMETGYIPEKETVNVNGVLEGVIKIVQAQYPAARFDTVIEPDEIKVKVDRIALQTCLLNLVENAAKYSGENAEIRATIKRKDDALDIKVSDNGPGISPNERQKVFRKFYRIGSENTRTTKGTGLGLYIVHQIIKLNGGSAEVLENPAGGSVFHITLPAKLESA